MSLYSLFIKTFFAGGGMGLTFRGRESNFLNAEWCVAELILEKETTS